MGELLTAVVLLAAVYGTFFFGMRWIVNKSGKK